MAEASQTKTKGRTSGSLNNQGDLDSRLLHGEEAQRQRAGDLRKSRRQKNDQEESGEAPDSLRKQALQAKAQRKKEKLKAQAKAKIQKLNPVYQGTKKALKASWMYLIASFGLTIIYINIHVFLRIFLPVFFCKLGDEWVPDEALAKIQSTEKGQATVKMTNMIESWGLVILDLLLLLIILGIALLISMLLDIVSHPISFLTSLVADWFD